MPEPFDPRRTLEETQDHAPSVGSGADETVAPSATEKHSDAPTFAPPSRPDEVGVLGPYRIVKELGRGGMGAVYAAIDSRLERKLALKVMLPQFAADQSAKERFLREARAAAQITHDNVVTVYEADERDGVPYIAMQFLQGYPLDEFLKKKGNPSLPQILRIARETASGLAAAHRIGLVHRDVKPANLWLEAPNGRVKVLDFGLARPIDADVELTKSGAVVGTPAYMSPEQARGLKVDHRTDLFSLGVLLYRLTTGRLPFQGPTTMAVLMALGVEEPTPVRKLDAEVPESLAALIHQLLAKKPDERPASADDVAKRLREIAESLARPVAASEATSSPPAPIQVTAAAAANSFANLKPTRLDAAPMAPGNVPRWKEPNGEASRRPTWIIALACGFLLPLVALGIIFYWETPEGVVRFEINDPQVKVTIDKEGPTITGADPKPITLKPGKHGLTITRGDFRFGTKAFELKKGDESLLKIEFLPGRVQVSRDGTLLDAKDHPSKPVADAAVDAERKAAEWVLAEGGIVQVNDSEQLIGERDKLPNGRIVLNGVTLKTRDVSADEFAVLGDCTSLRTLHLGPNNVGDEHLARLRRCGRLYSVYLWRTNVTEVGVRSLGRFKELTTLALGGPRVTDACIDVLTEFGALRQLTLGGANLTDAALKLLPRLGGLEYLNLTETGVTDDGLAHVVACKSLKSLVLHGAFSDVGLESLRALPGLASLDVKSSRLSATAEGKLRAALPRCRVTIEHVAATPAVTSIDPDRKAAEWVLSLGGGVLLEGGEKLQRGATVPSKAFKVSQVDLTGARQFKNSDLGMLAACNSLDLIAAYYVPISDEGVMRLKGCPIINLQMAGAAVTDAGIEFLKDLPNLKTLDLRFLPITDRGLATLGALPVLEDLMLGGSRVTDSSIAQAVKAAKLRDVQLVETRITSDGLKLLARHPQIVALTLQKNQIGDRDLAALRTATRLTRLALVEERVTDVGLECLAALTALNELSLESTQTTDRGLATLKSRKALKNLNLRGTKVTAQGAAAFHAAVPGCRIEFDGGVIEPATASDPDRKAAEWVIATGGHVSVVGSRSTIEAVDRLPAGAFKVRMALLGKVKNPDEGLELLAGCQRLEQIYLGSSGVTDAGFARLKSLPNFTAIVLSWTNVTDVSVARLAGCHKLAYLHLNGIPVTDDGLAALKDLKELTYLQLADTKVSDAGLVHLKGLKNLKELRLTQTKATAKGIADLQAALPGCKIAHGPRP